LTRQVRQKRADRLRGSVDGRLATLLIDNELGGPVDVQISDSFPTRPLHHHLLRQPVLPHPLERRLPHEIIGSPNREPALNHQLGPNPDGAREVFARDRGKRWLRDWAELRQPRQQVPLDILRKTSAELASKDQFAASLSSDPFGISLSHSFEFTSANPNAF